MASSCDGVRVPETETGVPGPFRGAPEPRFRAVQVAPAGEPAENLHRLTGGGCVGTVDDTFGLVACLVVLPLLEGDQRGERRGGRWLVCGSELVQEPVRLVPASRVGCRPYDGLAHSAGQPGVVEPGRRPGRVVLRHARARRGDLARQGQRLGPDAERLCTHQAPAEFGGLRGGVGGRHQAAVLHQVAGVQQAQPGAQVAVAGVRRERARQRKVCGVEARNRHVCRDAEDLEQRGGVFAALDIEHGADH